MLAYGEIKIKISDRFVFIQIHYSSLRRLNEFIHGELASGMRFYQQVELQAVLKLKYGFERMLNGFLAATRCQANKNFLWRTFDS
ncbi:hypothetical protein CE91St35_07060 [Eggerthella lenta]|nr:hypothetical protein CE91St35_07060 [Eggerthella lenta]